MSSNFKPVSYTHLTPSTPPHSDILKPTFTTVPLIDLTKFKRNRN